MAHPDFTKNFILYTDASYLGYGYILGQIQDGKEVVIEYAGRALKGGEKHYAPTKMEAAAVVAGVRHFH